MYDQPLPDDILFYMLYGGVAVLTFVASCYLLFRRGNAFAQDITTPIRLRRWTAAFFAAMTLSHLWYLPTAFADAGDEVICGICRPLLPLRAMKLSYTSMLGRYLTSCW